MVSRGKTRGSITHFALCVIRVTKSFVNIYPRSAMVFPIGRFIGFHRLEIKRKGRKEERSVEKASI